MGKMRKLDISRIEAKNIERHLPKYQFCGPGTKVFTRLSQGEKGINDLDKACRIHDIEYLKYAGDNDGLREADRRLRRAARNIGGLAGTLVDKAFFLKQLGEKLHFFTLVGFAAKLSKNFTIPQQRMLGKLLYDKYILNKNIDLHAYYI